MTDTQATSAETSTTEQKANADSSSDIADESSTKEESVSPGDKREAPCNDTIDEPESKKQKEEEPVESSNEGGPAEEKMKKVVDACTDDVPSTTVASQ